MKKKWTRALAMLCTLALSLTLAVPVLAEEPDPADSALAQGEQQEEFTEKAAGTDDADQTARASQDVWRKLGVGGLNEVLVPVERDGDGFIRGVEENSDYWWKLEENGTLTIRGKSMPDFEPDTKPEGDPLLPFWYQYQVSNVVIEPGIQNIGSYAFAYCGFANGLTLPGSVTHIGEGAFQYARLEHAVLPDSVTTIGAYAFRGAGLTEIVIPNGVTAIGNGAFWMCEKLASVTLPASVTKIENFAFAQTAITSIEIPSGVTGIEWSTFVDCKNLTSITLPATVTNIGNYAFNGCESLEKIQLPNSVETIGPGAFQATALKNIAIPASVTAIGNEAFRDCTSLSEIRFEGSAPEMLLAIPGVSENEQAFHFGGVNATVYYPANDPSYTEVYRQNYNGTLTWTPYEPEKPTDPETPADPEKPEDPAAPGTPNTWGDTSDGWKYYDKNGEPLTGSCWIEALGHRYVFDDNGSLLTGNATGDLLWEGNQYYLNPDRDPNDPTTCYCVTNYTRNRPGVGVTYYNQDGITYRGWVDGGSGKLLYQTVLRGTDGKELKDEAGFSTYIYVWGGQQIPEGLDPRDPAKIKTIPAGNYLFGEDGVLVTGKTGWYTISGSSAIAGEYYLTAADGHCALNTTQWDDAKGHRYLFGADGRKVSAGPDGLDVALTINGQYQTVYLAPNTDYVACNYYRPRKDSKGGDLGLTYYNPDGITYRGWVDGGSGKRLYQTVMDIQGVGELYFIVWHAQYLPAGKDPVTKDPIPAGWYLFGEDGVLITKDGVYTVPDTKGVNHQYQVKDGKIVAIDGKAPTTPKGA